MWQAKYVNTYTVCMALRKPCETSFTDAGNI